MSCPVCSSSFCRLLYPGNQGPTGTGYRLTDKAPGQHSDIWLCQDCSAGFVKDRELIEGVRDSYQASPVDEVYEHEQAGRQKTNRKIITRITDMVRPPARLLDVGCYTGLFLQNAAQAGFEVCGLEPSSSAAAQARRRLRANIKQGYVEQAGDWYEADYFDVITLFDVIEHLSEPCLAVSWARQKLKPHGLLVMTTPDRSSFMSKWRKEKWHAILKHHLVYFTRDNLCWLLRQNKFEIVKVVYQTRHFSLQYLLRILSDRLRLAFLTKTLGRFPLLGRIIIPINIMDQVAVFARKTG